MQSRHSCPSSFFSLSLTGRIEVDPVVETGSAGAFVRVGAYTTASRGQAGVTLSFVNSGFLQRAVRLTDALTRSDVRRAQQRGEHQSSFSFAASPSGARLGRASRNAFNSAAAFP